MNVKFSYTSEGLAGLILLSFGGGYTRSDQKKLAEILQRGFDAGALEAIKGVKNRYRELHPGGCRMFSLGDRCDCFLCELDQMALEVEKQRKEPA